MKKLVPESLNEYLNEETVKKAKKQKATAKQPAKTTVVYDQSTNEKAKQAIAGLKVQLKDAKKPGALRGSKAEQEAKVKGIEEKIAKWEAKMKKK